MTSPRVKACYRQQKSFTQSTKPTEKHEHPCAKEVQSSIGCPVPLVVLVVHSKVTCHHTHGAPLTHLASKSPWPFSFTGH
eukprot:8108503-Pyramimonas_sp.AAC.2